MLRITSYLLPLLLLLTLTPSSHASQQCISYLQTLKNQSLSNPTACTPPLYVVLHSMTPYLILSGKSIDDLGFPGSCEQDDEKYRYSTVEVTIETNETEYTGYLGFCFVAYCGV